MSSSSSSSEITWISFPAREVLRVSPIKHSDLESAFASVSLTDASSVSESSASDSSIQSPLKSKPSVSSEACLTPTASSTIQLSPSPAPSSGKPSKFKTKAKTDPEESPDFPTIQKFLSEFVFGAASGIYQIQITSNHDRAVIHHICRESERLASHSVGKGFNRFACVYPRMELSSHSSASSSATSSSTLESDVFIMDGHYLSLIGPSVEAAAAPFLAAGDVPEAYQSKRHDRDGKRHHITLINGDELNQMALAYHHRTSQDSASSSMTSSSSSAPSAESQADEIDALASVYATSLIDRMVSSGDELSLRNDWRALGLGRVQQSSNEAVFVAVDWPSLLSFRTKLGLPEVTPHITLGFKAFDIHHVSKGPETVIKSMP